MNWCCMRRSISAPNLCHCLILRKWSLCISSDLYFPLEAPMIRARKKIHVVHRKELQRRFLQKFEVFGTIAVPKTNTKSRASLQRQKSWPMTDCVNWIKLESSFFVGSKNSSFFSFTSTLTFSAVELYTTSAPTYFPTISFSFFNLPLSHQKYNGIKN